MRMRKLFDSFGAAKKCHSGDFTGIPVLRSVHAGRQGAVFEEYYIRADKALYYVKQNGKNSYRFYEELDNSRRMHRPEKMTWR